MLSNSDKSGVIFNENTEAEVVGEYCESQCKGKFIVVTGAAPDGIGYETTRVLCKFGADVFVCCHTEESCNSTIRSIQGALSLLTNLEIDVLYLLDE